MSSRRQNSATGAFSRRRFITLAGGATLPLLLSAGLSGAQTGRRPQDIRVQMHWNKYLALHCNLRVLGSGKGQPAPDYAAAVETYRRHLFLVPGREIWFALENHIAPVDTPEGLRGQLSNVFPLSFRMYDLKPTGQAIAEAILQCLPAFEKSEWPQLETRRRQELDPAIKLYFEPKREKLMSFLMTSFNASPLPLAQIDFHMVDRYINTGHHMQELNSRFFSVVETRRFKPLEMIETIVMLLGQIIEQADRSNSRGALYQLRERQGILQLPNPVLFPRAVHYWTAGEAVRRLLDPSHQHVAETRKIYPRALRIFVPALNEFWNPYLDGKLSLDEALNGMIRRVAES